MDKTRSLENIGNRLHKPTCALLGVTLLAGTVTITEQGLEQESPQLFMLERSEDVSDFISLEAAPAAPPTTVPFIEQEDAAATDTVIGPELIITTVPAEPPPLQETTVPAEPPVEITVPPTTSTTAPPALLLDQSDSSCPAAWETVGQNICYTQQAGFHVIQVDVSSPDISVCPAFVSGPGRLGSLADAARQMNAIAATNSSFFYENGRALGPLACAGQWLSQDPYPQVVFAHHADGTVTMEHTEQALQQDVASLRFAVSGSHVLVRDGQVVQDFGEDNEGGMLYKPHERTVIGMGEGQRLYMAVTETGNRVTMPQLAQHMGSLGIRNAVNLDGGGSSQMHMNNQDVVPSDRQVSTGFFVVPSL